MKKRFTNWLRSEAATAIHHSMVNVRDRVSAFEKRIGRALGGRTGAQCIFCAQDLCFQRRDPRLELMRRKRRQILAQDDVGLGFLGREFVEIDSHCYASFALPRNLGITRCWSKKVEPCHSPRR